RHAEAAHDETALPDRVDLTVDTSKRRHQETTAAQARRVPDRVDRDVASVTRFRERRQIRAHRHGGDILELRVDVGGNRHAELRKHVANALDRERRLARLIAGAVETYDETVTHELVTAHAGDRRKILDALRVRRARCEHHDERQTRERRARSAPTCAVDCRICGRRPPIERSSTSQLDEHYRYSRLILFVYLPARPSARRSIRTASMAS